MAQKLDGSSEMIAAAVEEAIKEEREACAKLMEAEGEVCSQMDEVAAMAVYQAAGSKIRARNSGG